MGILATTMRLMVLTNSKNDFEMRLMTLAEKMTGLTARIADLDDFNTDLNPNDPRVRQLESEKKDLNRYEKKLEMQQKMLQAQLQEVTQEMQACQQSLQQSIQSSGFFSYGLGGR